MTFKFDERDLMQVLDRLSPFHRTAFATACADTLSSLLSQSNVVPALTKETITNAVELLRADVREEGAGEVDWQAVLDHVMTLLPDANGAWPEHHYLIDDSAASVAYAIRTRLTGSSQEAAWSARRCYEYFDHVANRDFTSRGVEEPTEEMLLSHPETQKELKRQHDLLESLGNEDGSR